MRKGTDTAALGKVRSVSKPTAYRDHRKLRAMPALLVACEGGRGRTWGERAEMEKRGGASKE